jgi:NADPH2:quinone reductase
VKALQVTELGEPEAALSITELPRPEPGDGEVLVQVLAAAANFPDVLMCRGHYQVKPSLPFVPGIEVCGRVVDPGRCQLSIGERVLGSALTPHGGFADYALMNAACTFRAPDRLDAAEAAALHVAYQTAWFAPHRRADLQAGDTLLVHAGAGGVGSAAVQLGKAAGARVIAVVGSPGKVVTARRLGANIVVDRTGEDFVTVVNDATGGRGADVVFDPVGGDSYHRSTRCIAFEGRIVVVGFAGGDVQTAALNHTLIKNYSVMGVHWGLYEKNNPRLVTWCHDALAELADTGAVRPLVSERLRLEEVADGLRRLADGTTVGRLVYEPGDPA